MEQDIVVFFVNDWKMDNGNTGCTVNYFFLDENGQIPTVVTGLSGPAGYQRAKVSLPAAERNKFVIVPGRYSGLFQMTVGSDGKPVLKLTEILKYKHPMYMSNINPDSVVGGANNTDKDTADKDTADKGGKK